MALMKYGICYSPTWAGWSPPYANNKENAQFSDADFFNDSFQALWTRGTDEKNNAFRNDMDTMASTGFTLLRLYNWGPTRGWNGTSGEAHLNFLHYAKQKGMQVSVPISNYFVGNDEYAWNTNNPKTDYSFDSAPTAIQNALNTFLGSVTDPDTGKIHEAVHSFSVSNELDLNTMADVDSKGRTVDPASRLARVLWWVVNLQRRIADQRLGTVWLTIPISNADQGGAGTNPRSYWFGAFVNGVTAGSTPVPFGTNPASGTFASTWPGLASQPAAYNRYCNSVNIYQYGDGLTKTIGQYDNWSAKSGNADNWPGQQFKAPLLLTEIGSMRSGDSSNGQANQSLVITSGIAVPLQVYAKNYRNTLLMGYCLYEFNDEPSLNANWGVFMAGGRPMYSEPTGTTKVSYAEWPSTNYPVEQLRPVLVNGQDRLVDALKKIFGS